MAVVEIKSILPYLVGSIPIGVGTTAVCFLNVKNEVIKLYYNSGNTYELFHSRDMLEHLKYISDISNNTYIGPKDILVKKNKVIGYTYPYVYKDTLSKMPSYMTKREILCGYAELLSNTRRISEQKFRLYDIHHKNVLFNNGYKIIDLDKGYVETNEKYLPNLFIDNMRQIIKIIIEQLYDLKIDEHLSFTDEDLQKLYIYVLYEQPNRIYELMDRIFYNCETKGDVKARTKIKKIKEDSSYHQMM